MPPPLPHAWRADLWQRARHLFLLKALGTTAFTGLFFVAYFQLLRHPAYPVAEMPLTPLDAWVPFQPAAIVAYLSLWFYVGIAPGLQRGLGELVAHGAWAAALCATGLLIFHFWPTRVPLLPRDASTFPGFDVLRGVDAAGNACPSMHVAIALFSAVAIDRLCRAVGVPWPARLFNLAWFAAIVWSTLAVRQHVVLDVLAGGVLGGVFALASGSRREAGAGATRVAMIRSSETFLRRASSDGAERRGPPGVAHEFADRVAGNDP